MLKFKVMIILSMTVSILTISPHSHLLKDYISTLNLRTDALSFTGYECTHPNTSFQTYDLTKVAPCVIDTELETSVDQSIQLIEIKRTRNIDIYMCNVEIIAHVFNCGAFSHLAITHNSLVNYYHYLDSIDCKALIKNNQFRFLDRDLVGLKPDFINIRQFEIGRVSSTDCSNDAEFMLNGITYQDAVASVSIKISYKKDQGTKLVDKDIIITPLGQSCTFTNGECILSNVGQLHWDTFSNEDCMTKSYQLIYEGISKKITSKQDNVGDVYLVEDRSYVFSLKSSKEINICGYYGITTEHPDLIVIEADDKSRYKIPSLDMNITISGNLVTYLNTKVVYMERIINANLESMYNDLLYKQCNNERMILLNHLHDAQINPNGFAKFITKREGSMGILAGEVIHVMNCPAIPVQLRTTNKCYQEIPITYGNNRTGFVSPLNHLIIDIGTEITCSDSIPPLFNIHQNWYKIIENIRKVEQPLTLEPSTKRTWKPHSSKNTIFSGIYSQDIVENTLDVIYYGRNKQSMMHTAARIGYDTSADQQNYDISRSISDESLKGLFVRYYNSLTSITDLIGHYTSLGIGLWFIYTCILWVFNTIMRALSIRKIGGNSKQLLASIHSGFTHYITSSKIQTNPVSQETIEIPLNNTSNVPIEGIDQDTVSQKLYPIL